MACENICLTDRDRMEDLLSCEKHLIAEYSTFLPETTSHELRSIFADNMHECAQDQLTVFDAMEKQGWYQIKNAQSSEVTTVRDKFTDFKTKIDQ